MGGEGSACAVYSVYKQLRDYFMQDGLVQTPLALLLGVPLNLVRYGDDKFPLSRPLKACRTSSCNNVDNACLLSAQCYM